MSLERRLILPVFLGLLTSLLVGATLSYHHAVSQVRIEMKAAIAVGRRVTQLAVEGRTNGDAPGADPLRLLTTIVDEFDGDRHVRLMLQDADGNVVRQSTLAVPDHPAPQIVFDLVSGRSMQAEIDLPPQLRTAGRLLIEADPQNEVAEAWGDLELALIVMSVFFCLILSLTIYTLRTSLRPLQDLAAALGRIGARDYDARLDWPRYRELEPVQHGFNSMAARLAEMDMRNRLLAARMQRLQEDERTELARDLHDDVAPFLFAVSVDASLIRQLVASRDYAAVEARAGGILDSVGHMQTHLREVLARLMPDVLLDLGLPGAVDALVHFWRARKPEIAFVVDVAVGTSDAGTLDAGFLDAEVLDERCATVAFRVVQESLSNAIRHAAASRIGITVRGTGAGLEIEITDDGRGLPAGSTSSGLGLLGMRERVRLLGGSLEIGNRPGGGVLVRAVLANPLSQLAIS